MSIYEEQSVEKGPCIQTEAISKKQKHKVENQSKKSKKSKKKKLQQHYP